MSTDRLSTVSCRSEDEKRPPGLPVHEGLPPYFSSQVTRARRFFLDPARATTERLIVCCGGREDAAADYVVDRSGFPFFTVEFVASGKGGLRLGRSKQALRAGVLFSHGPGCSHHIQTDPVDRLVKYFVCFSGAGATEALKSYHLSPGSIRQVQSVSQLRSAFDQLIEFASHPSPETDELCALQVRIILSLSVRNPAAPAVSRSCARIAFDRCRTLATEKFLELQSAQDLANAGHVETAYLCRLFRKFAGTSPYQYLFKLKMAWAAEQLYSRDVLIRTVADRLGVDPFQFSRGFKRVHGMSPIAFRQLRAGSGDVDSNPVSQL